MFLWRSVFSRLARRFPKPRHIQFNCLSSTNARAACLEFCEDFLKRSSSDKRGWDDRESDQEIFSRLERTAPVPPSWKLEVRGVAEVHHTLRMITKQHRYPD
jgi:CHAD domain-containing protein